MSLVDGVPPSPSAGLRALRKPRTLDGSPLPGPGRRLTRLDQLPRVLKRGLMPVYLEEVIAAGERSVVLYLSGVPIVVVGDAEQARAVLGGDPRFARNVDPTTSPREPGST